MTGPNWDDDIGDYLGDDDDYYDNDDDDDDDYYDETDWGDTWEDF